MMCLAVRIFGFILFGTLCTSWTCMFIFFTKLGDFSVIIFSNRLSISCSLSSLLAPLCCECWYAWICPRGSLHYPHVLGFIFLLVVLIEFFFVSLYTKSLIWVLAHPLYCWWPINCSSLQLVYPSFPNGYFLWLFYMVFFYAVEVLSSSAPPLSSFSILITSVLNSACSRWLIVSILFIFFF